MLALPFLVVAALLIVYPFVQLVSTAVGEPAGVGNFGAFFRSSADVRTLIFTVVDSTIVTACAVAIGAFLAWSIYTAGTRIKQLLLLMAVFVPVWMGAVVKIYAFTAIFQPAGILNGVLSHLGFASQPTHLLYTQAAVVIGMSYQMVPYAVATMYAVFATIDLRLIRAAQSLGASHLRALRTIVLPLSLPGAMASSVIVYVIALGYYLTPVLLGGATAPFTASLVADDIFTYYNVPEAAVSSVILLAVALMVVTGGSLAVGRDRLARAVG